MGCPKIGDLEIEPRLHLPVGLFRETDRARLANALQSGGDVDAVAHEIAVALLDNVAKMNADAKLDALFRGKARVALDHPALHFDRAAHRVNNAAEFDDRAIARALDDTPPVHRDDRIDQVAA